MKLFLASEAKNPQSMADLERFIGGFEGKRVVYIPTAANGEELYGNWIEGGTWNLVNKLPMKVTPLVLEEINDPKQLNTLNDADIIWLAGGYWGYLMYWMRRLKLDKRIPELAKKGAFIVGSSAGAGVMSKSLEIAEWWRYDVEEDPEPEIGASIIPGLGLVDFDLYPHYKENLKNYISENYRGDKMYLLKDGESIEVKDHRVKVNGVERIIGNYKKR